MLGDRLEQHGDPRGVLIALQLGKLDAQAKKQLVAHRDYLLGALAPLAADDLTWQFGFIPEGPPPGRSPRAARHLGHARARPSIGALSRALARRQHARDRGDRGPRAACTADAARAAAVADVAARSRVAMAGGAGAQAALARRPGARPRPLGAPRARAAGDRRQRAIERERARDRACGMARAGAAQARLRHGLFDRRRVDRRPVRPALARRSAQADAAGAAPHPLHPRARARADREPDRGGAARGARFLSNQMTDAQRDPAGAAQGQVPAAATARRLGQSAVDRRDRRTRRARAEDPRIAPRRL